MTNGAAFTFNAPENVGSMRICWRTTLTRQHRFEELIGRRCCLKAKRCVLAQLTITDDHLNIHLTLTDMAGKQCACRLVNTEGIEESFYSLW